ncbi:MAG TPA: hypothetical protein VEJ63_20205, partial [Planctomycetota bacterium]|nr:hypothetical protein [Planctomycetota bacterium]
MLQRSMIVRFAVPVIALGVLVMCCASPELRAAESGVVASASTVRRTTTPARTGKSAAKTPVKTAARTKVAKPAAKPAPVAPEQTERREIDSIDAWGQV